MTQEDAFIRQARSDYSVFERLRAESRSDVPECHVLHYFQMATEKLAKAVLARSGEPVAYACLPKPFAFGAKVSSFP